MLKWANGGGRLHLVVLFPTQKVLGREEGKDVVPHLIVADQQAPLSRLHRRVQPIPADITTQPLSLPFQGYKRNHGVITSATFFLFNSLPNLTHYPPPLSPRKRTKKRNCVCGRARVCQCVCVCFTSPFLLSRRQAQSGTHQSSLVPFGHTYSALSLRSCSNRAAPCEPGSLASGELVRLT
jgi:hypothetical protein